MNKIFTSFLFSLSFLTVYGQNGSIQDITDIGAVFINVPYFSYDGKLPVHKIELADFRDDTLKVGFIHQNKSIKRILIQGNTRTRLEEILNTSLRKNPDSTEDASLTIVLKRLWIKGTDENFCGGSSVRNNSALFESAKCFAILEVYLKKQGFYHPLFRMDDSFFTDDDSKMTGSNLLIAPFKSCLQKLAKIDLPKAIASRKLTWREIADSYRVRKECPVLSYFAGKTKGVFLTFEDFRQNKITPKDFLFEKGKLTNQLYEMDHGVKTMITDYWGYCDGQKYYIRSGFSFFELFRNQYTFEFIGVSTPVTPKFNSADIGSIAFDLITPANDEFLKAYQLDMTTGKPF